MKNHWRDISGSNNCSGRTVKVYPFGIDSDNYYGADTGGIMM